MRIGAGEQMVVWARVNELAHSYTFTSQGKYTAQPRAILEVVTQAGRWILTIILTKTKYKLGWFQSWRLVFS